MKHPMESMKVQPEVMQRFLAKCDALDCANGIEFLLDRGEEKVSAHDLAAVSAVMQRMQSMLMGLVQFVSTMDGVDHDRLLACMSDFMDHSLTDCANRIGTAYGPKARASLVKQIEIVEADSIKETIADLYSARPH